MPDQNQVNEYKKKIAVLSLDDLRDILSHINKDKLPWKFDLVKAEIKSKETGKPVSVPDVVTEKPTEDKVSKEPVEEEKESEVKEEKKVKPAFRLRGSKLGVDKPEEKAEEPEPVKEEVVAETKEEPVQEEPVPEAPAKSEKSEEKAAPQEEVVVESKEEPVREEVAPEPAAVPEKVDVKIEKKEVKESKKDIKTSSEGVSPLDYALLSSGIVLLIVAAYIVATAFVSLPGGDLIKGILEKIPLF
ncbi:MAG: hypothetical protein P9M13_08350 [Candidatus Ancaeobacter aquaticus]|nr:hypothetical protein [Candidatus Ancaeobacter aquaticus]